MADVPENGETVSLSMAGFPGRWLRILCLLISFTLSTFPHSAGPAEHGACCQGAPRPRPTETRVEASDCGLGRGMPGIAVGNLGPGCCDTLFHFPSPRLLQAGELHQAPLAHPSVGCHFIQTPALPWDSCPAADPCRPGARSGATVLAFQSRPQGLVVPSAPPAVSTPQDCLSPGPCHPCAPLIIRFRFILSLSSA